MQAITHRVSARLSEVSKHTDQGVSTEGLDGRVERLWSHGAALGGAERTRRGDQDAGAGRRVARRSGRVGQDARPPRSRGEGRTVYQVTSRPLAEQPAGEDGANTQHEGLYR